MIVVSASPPGGTFIEFLRANITASDDGNSPLTAAPYEIVYTTDGRVPVFTTLTAPLSADATTANVVSTAGFPPVGMLTIRQETVVYSGLTGTTFTGLVRGALGTTPATHANLSRVLAFGVSIRRSPIRNLPIDGPTTIKFYARTVDGSFQTDVMSVFYNVTEVIAKNEIRTATPDIRNYTLAVTNGDIALDGRGLYSIVSGDRKTAQDIREIILVENVPTGTPVGNRTLPQFGSALPRILGKALPLGFTRGQIQTTIFQALTYLSELQREEHVPSDEQIDKILSISVEAIDPTSFRYHFLVQTVSGVQVPNTGVIGG